ATATTNVLTARILSAPRPAAAGSTTERAPSTDRQHARKLEARRAGFLRFASRRDAPAPAAGRPLTHRGFSIDASDSVPLRAGERAASEHRRRAAPTAPG